MGLDTKPNLSARVMLREQEPFKTLLNMAGERVVAKSETRPVLIGLIADGVHANAIQKSKAKHFDLKQHVAPLQGGARVEMPDDDPWI